MKRTLSLVLILALLATLFCVPFAVAETLPAQSSIRGMILEENAMDQQAKASYAGFSCKATKTKVTTKPGAAFTVKLKANKSSIWSNLVFGYTKSSMLQLIGATISGKTATLKFRCYGQPGQSVKINFGIPKSSTTMAVLCSVKASIKAIPVSSVSMAKKATLYVDSNGYSPIYQLQPTVKPYNATKPAITFSSSNKKVASVNKYTGEVTAKKAGKAKITAKAGNGKKAVCTITVKKTSTPHDSTNKTTYRALMISNTWYKNAGDLPGDIETTQAFATALRNCTYNGEKFSSIRILADQTGAQMRSALDGLSTGWGIDDNDVTLFYYSGHGGNEGGYNSYLCGTDTNAYNWDGDVTVAQLEAALDKVPGTVYVVLDSCHSGGFISKDGGKDTGSDEEFISGLIRPFQLTSKDLQKSKYHVLAAAAHDQTSISWLNHYDGQYWSQTTYWLTLGGGYEMFSKALGDMEADANGDGVVTFYEAWKYTDAACYDEAGSDAPDMKIWPANDSTVLFSRN